MKTGGGSISRRARAALAAAAAVIIATTLGATVAARAQDGAPSSNPDMLYERAPSPDGARAAPPDGTSATAVPAASVAAPEASPAAPPAAPNSAAADSSTIMVPDSMPAPAYVNQNGAIPPATTVIPGNTGVAPADGGDPADENQIINYEAQQNPQLIDPQLHSLQEFMEEGSETSPLGIEVREDQRKLKDGEVADGLLVVGVVTGSPAAKAGLHPYRRTARNILEGAAIAASFVFPPAVVAVPMIESVNLGESYDLIIGIDGARVSNFLDFEEHMRDVQPGEIVYLSVVRNGRRVQLPVPVPNLIKAPGF